MTPPTDVFISYSSADRPIVKDLSDLLSQVYEVWLDRKLAGGDKWWSEILQKISECNHFIYLISRESLDSEWCKKELLEAQQLGKHIIPVLVRARTEIPKELQAIQIVDMSNGITAKNLNQLYKALIKTTNHITRQEIDEKKRSADLRLLDELWPLISIGNIIRLDDETQCHYICADFYNGTITKYLDQRNLRDYPQNTFFNPALEESFKSFDETLRAYNLQLLQAYSFDVRRGREVLMSDYKTCVLERNPPVPMEIINYKLEEYQKTVDLVLELRERHNELATTIRDVFPDFDFSGEQA